MKNSKKYLDKSKKEIGQRVKEYRKLKGLTQVKLAEICGIKQPTVARFESGNLNTTLDVVLKMLNACDAKLTIGNMETESSKNEG